MANMALTPEEKKDMGEAPSLIADKPKYPYGLKIHLTDKEIKKLGLKEAPAVGESHTAIIRVEVVGVNSENMEGDVNEFNVCLQITDMEFDKKEEKSENSSAVFYGA